ncbi:hypothetical protein SLEP1_g25620 [Rubroshorea leprosula]|uniref:ATP-dependent DNA helicase n=1 Tax=Rubroshorea leprosula TaxID=152421 RepID=A0AAV5JQQ4_9ROSI|nr:hypothetical protein SLEP1_g25620 [Rubroshorea leprosula]
MFDTHNPIVQVFRSTRDRFKNSDNVELGIRLIGRRESDPKTYERPTTSEVVALIVRDLGNCEVGRDVVVEHKYEGLKRITELHPLFMALQYPILFPYGEDGYHVGIPYHKNEGKRKTKRQTLTMTEYYGYIIQFRRNEGNTLILGGRLFQQFVVDAFIAIEEEHLRYVRNEQDKWRMELYKNVCDVIVRGDTMAESVGKRIILPSSFTGSPRYMIQNYQDAMAICRSLGYPDLCITFTSNGKWPKIKYMLNKIPGQDVENRPDIEARVFKLKLQQLMKDITEKKAFGTVIGGCEACWRIFHFDIHYRNPSVMRLFFHLKDEQKMVLRDSQSLTEAIEQEGVKDTMFTKWMEMNVENKEARSLTYAEFPTKFVWNGKEWTKRKRGRTIGRITYAHPTSGERYYLHILLNVIRGPRTYEELKNVNGTQHTTFKQACYAFGLISDDKEWNDAIDEARHWTIGPQLRELFITILLFCEVNDPIQFWEVNCKTLSEDIPFKLVHQFNFPNLKFTEDQIKNYCLLELERMQNRSGKSLSDYNGMPLPNMNLLFGADNRLIKEELNYDIRKMKADHDNFYISLNNQQREIYHRILDAVEQKEGGIFFVYGHEGIGKTFLYKTILSRLRSERKIALAVASSGIASLLLLGGRTAHS